MACEECGKMVGKKMLKSHLKIHLRERGVTEEEANTQGLKSIGNILACIFFKLQHECLTGNRAIILYSGLNQGLEASTEKLNPSERSELRYGVRGLGFHCVVPLSPPRGLCWEGYNTSHMVKVSALHVLH